jgi:hypothetical protein
MAYSVKYIVRSINERPVLVEPAPAEDLDTIVELARERLQELRHMLNPVPSGFVVLDQHGREVRRWIEK